jgi:hypothetical protein
MSPMLPSNRLFRVLAINGLLGALLGVAFVAGLIALDTAGLRRLILGDPEGHFALLLLTLGFVVTCSSVMMGSAIMQHRVTDDDRPMGGGPPKPVPVRLDARRKQR